MVFLISLLKNFPYSVYAIICFFRIYNIDIKSKNTSSQASLDRKKRLTNLHGSFKLASPLTNSIKTVIVIDDITTTGSTLQEIAQCIKNSYPHVRVR